MFIPLGGSRVAPLRIYSNLIVTMFVSGVWHGAGTNFMVWGLWHGMMLAGASRVAHIRGAAETPQSADIGAGVLTFVSVNLGWAFFCMDLPTARLFLSRMIFVTSVETFIWLKQLIDYIGGAADEPPAGAPSFVTDRGVRRNMVGAPDNHSGSFSGQTSKFIYIDF